MHARGSFLAKIAMSDDGGRRERGRDWVRAPAFASSARCQEVGRARFSLARATMDDRACALGWMRFACRAPLTLPWRTA